MTCPRVTFLINGRESGIEAIRARGLARRIPAGQAQFLFRESGRWTTYRRWNAEVAQFKPDVLYVINTAIPGVPVACRRFRRGGIPFVLDTGDAVVEMAIRSGIGAGWRVPILRWLERSGLTQAHTVVVRGTRHRELLLKQGVRRVALIRDGYAEQTSVPPEAVAELRRRLGLEGRWVVGLLGSLVFSPKLRICYGWDVVEALSMLADLPVTAVVIGDGTGLGWLKSQAHRLGVLNQMVFTGRIPYAEVPRYLRLMDVAISTQTNNIPGQVRTTGKLPEYMAAGRFILASRVGEAALLLPEIMLLDYEGEVDRGYPSRLAERIRHLVSNPGALELRHFLPGQAEALCAYDVLAAQFSKVISQVVNSDNAS